MALKKSANNIYISTLINQVKHIMLSILYRNFFLLISTMILWSSTLSAAGLEERVITIRGNERFELVNNSYLQFKFQPLSDEAKALEITKDASSLGVSYLGQLQLKGNFSTLSALRSIGDQIADSLEISFGVIADSNSSQALKTNELILLYHPQAIITLSLVRVNDQIPYEIVCTYALKNVVPTDPAPLLSTNPAKVVQEPAQVFEESATEIPEKEIEKPAVIETE